MQKTIPQRLALSQHTSFLYSVFISPKSLYPYI
jgi:hypothetical protein